MEITQIEIKALIPYINNPKTHSDDQVAKIASSIKEFGFNNPVLIDPENGIIAGHGRVLAAKKLELEKVPCVKLTHLTEAQRKAYIIADNRLAEVGSEWNLELLQLEMEALLEQGFETELTGFDMDEINSLLEQATHVNDAGYTAKVETPIYEITGEQPGLGELVDTSKTDQLTAEIMASNVPPAIMNFLAIAAQRHTVFDYGKIAEFYAHADPETQALMENSALVIIDFDRAIENGFVSLSEKIAKQYGSEAGIDEE